MPFRARVLPSSLLKRRLAATTTSSQSSTPGAVRALSTLSTSKTRPQASKPYPFQSLTYTHGRLRDRSSRRHASTTPDPHHQNSAAYSSALSAISQLFSLRPRTPGSGSKSLTPNNARGEFIDAAEKGDLGRMMAAYTMFLPDPDADPVDGSGDPLEGGLSREDLVLGMRALNSHPDVYPATRCLARLYEDSAVRFGYPHGREERTCFVIGLLRVGRWDKAKGYLKELYRDGAGRVNGESKGDGRDKGKGKEIEVEVDQPVDLTAILQHMARRDGKSFVGTIWRYIEDRGSPTEEEWALYFRALGELHVEKIAKPWDLKNEFEIKKEFEKYKLAWERARAEGAADVPLHRRDGWVAGYRALVIGGDSSWSVMLRRLDKSHKLDDTEEGSPVVRSELEWTARIEAVLSPKRWNAEEAFTTFQGMREAGYDLPQVSRLVWRHVQQGMDLEDAILLVEGRLHTAVDSTCLFIYVDDRVRQLEAAAALNVDRKQSLGSDIVDVLAEVLGVARRRGIEIDWTAVKRFSDCLFASPISLETVMMAFDEARANEDGINTPSRTTLLTHIYSRMIVACSWTEPRETAKALRLLQYAAEDDISLTGSRDRPLRALVELMSAAPDHDTAYEMYVYYHRVNAIDSDQFKKIANAFIMLQPPDMDPVLPPGDLLLEMVKNMHLTGIKPGVEFYASLLHRYGVVASKGDELLKAQCLMAIEDVHNRLKLDSGIDIDVNLLNALMDAYARIGQADKALNTWNELVERRSRTDPAEANKQYQYSIAIALDMCAYNGLHSHLHRIWRWGTKHGYCKHVRQWNNLLEALCRLGRFDEAMDIVFVQMKEGGDVPEANADTLRVMSKMSWRDGAERRKFMAAVEFAYPELWAGIRHEGHARPRAEFRR